MQNLLDIVMVVLAGLLIVSATLAGGQKTTKRQKITINTNGKKTGRVYVKAHYRKA